MVSNMINITINLVLARIFFIKIFNSLIIMSVFLFHQVIKLNQHLRCNRRSNLLLKGGIRHLISF